VYNFAIKFQTLAEKTAKNLGGYFFAAPYSGIDAVADIERW